MDLFLGVIFLLMLAVFGAAVLSDCFTKNRQPNPDREKYFRYK